MTFIDNSLKHLSANSHDAKARAEKAMEANLIKQMLKASGAMLKGMGKGAQQDMVRDLFTEAIADAVAEQSPLGLGNGLAERGAEAAMLALVDGVGMVSSHFGERTDPIEGEIREHHGVDIAAPEGSRIRSAQGGIVTFAGERGGYGNLVEITHADGRVTRYAHAKQVLVKKGDKVQKGQVVGLVGSTGRSTGPHLHFEVRERGRAIDPTAALKSYSGRVDTHVGRKGPSSKGGPRG